MENFISRDTGKKIENFDLFSLISNKLMPKQEDPENEPNPANNISSSPLRQSSNQTKKQGTHKEPNESHSSSSGRSSQSSKGSTRSPQKNTNSETNLQEEKYLLQIESKKSNKNIKTQNEEEFHHRKHKSDFLHPTEEKLSEERNASNSPQKPEHFSPKSLKTFSPHMIKSRTSEKSQRLERIEEREEEQKDDQIHQKEISDFSLDGLTDEQKAAAQEKESQKPQALQDAEIIFQKAFDKNLEKVQQIKSDSQSMQPLHKLGSQPSALQYMKKNTTCEKRLSQYTTHYSNLNPKEEIRQSPEITNSSSQTSSDSPSFQSTKSTDLHSPPFNSDSLQDYNLSDTNINSNISTNVNREEIKEREREREKEKERDDERRFLIIDKDTGEVSDIRAIDTIQKLESEAKQFSRISSNVNSKTAWRKWWAKKRANNETLWTSAESNDLPAIHQLMDKTLHGDLIPDVNSKALDDWTALHFAANEGAYDAARLLLDYDAEIDTRTSINRTPFHIASMRYFIFYIFCFFIFC